MLILKFGFGLLMFLSAVYSIVLGGKPARLACLSMFIAAVATQLVTLDHDARWPLFLVDTALLYSLITISLRGDQYWPIWAAGLHGAGVAANIAVLASTQIDFKIYHAIIAVWSIPIFLVMPVGIFLDRRAVQHADARRQGGMGQNRRRH